MIRCNDEQFRHIGIDTVYLLMSDYDEIDEAKVRSVKRYLSKIMSLVLKTKLSIFQPELNVEK